jgi:hypothetical protein
MATLRTIVFFAVMALYLWYPFQMIQSQERILSEGHSCKMLLQPVDPYDAFRGRYIRLNYDTEVELGVDTIPADVPVYVSLTTDDNGFCRFDKAYLSPPSGPYIRTPMRSNIWKNKVSIQLPSNMERFYLNEKIAPLAEQAYRNIRWDANRASTSIQAYGLLKVLDGEVLVEQVYFEGQPIDEYVKATFMEEHLQD